MYDDNTRFILASSVLKGERDAHLILADMLDEAGDVANAQFARGEKKIDRKRFDLTLGLLPPPAVLFLSSEFAENIMFVSESTQTQATLTDYLFKIRELASTLQAPNVDPIAVDSAETIVDALPFLSDRSVSMGDVVEYFVPDLSQLFLCINRVAVGTLRLYNNGRHHEYSCTTEVGAASKQAASLCRSIVKTACWRMQGFRRRWDTEMTWQIERLQKFIEQTYLS